MTALRAPRHTGDTDALHALGAELDWFETALTQRMEAHFADSTVAGTGTSDTSAAPPAHGPSPLATLIAQHGLGAPERLLMALALAPHLRPEALDPLLIRNSVTGRRFGGTAQEEAGFRPTLQSAVFLLSGAQAHGDLHGRMTVARLMDEAALLRRAGLLELAAPVAGHVFTCPLEPGATLLRLLQAQTGPDQPPPDGFPASRIETNLHWDDLILPAPTRQGLEQIVTWARFAPDLAPDPRPDTARATGPARLFGPGFRCLMHGPPGTGKTLAAALLGQLLQRAVYRVDLSQVVSKWIGETEKNLGRVFDEAARHGWALFFDEADSLFGKRTDPNTANDRHANQEVAYILQRMEGHNGLVLLATNLRGHIDGAFTRRFQSVIYFPEPGPAERLAIWKNAFDGSVWLGPDIDLDTIAQDHPLTGATIVNCLHSALLIALSDGRTQLTAVDLNTAIAAEMRKQSRLKERPK